MARTVLKLPKHRDAWTWCVSPTKLMCVDGEILPELTKAWHTPGMNGNGAGRGQGQGFVSNLMAEGMVPIPHDIECEAFGESRAGAPLSAYIDRYEGVCRGRRVVYHSEAWERPYQLGNATDWQRDHEGKKAFLRKCLAMVSPDGLVELQVRLAVEPLVRRIRAALDRDDARGKRNAVRMFNHLPAEHCPEDLLAARAEALPKPKTQRKSAR
jgi:hypothetical protein|tara:strand:+ start:419 stop:1054 length:636 start_codon:yes stop_codon:yes gene_type:complete